MKKQRFAKGVKPTVADFNNLHDFTEEGVDTLLRALASSESGKILFDNLAPSASISGTTLTVTVPAQYFAINGAIAEVQETVRTFFADTDFQIAVDLVIRKDPLTEERSFTVIDPPSQVVINESKQTQVQTIDQARIVWSVNKQLAVTIPNPVLSATDSGFVRLATIKYDISETVGNQISITKNSNDLFVLPSGISVPVDSHAAQHLSNGSDPLQVASLSASEVGGSTEGVMPKGALTAALNGIATIEVSDQTPFLVASDSGSNSANSVVSTPKKITLTLNIHDSLTTHEDDTIKLGANFLPPTAVNGFSDFVARQDHTHKLAEGGFIWYQTELDLADVDLGDIVNFQVTSQNSGITASIVRIHGVNVFWQPPNIKAGFEARCVSASWNIVFDAGSNKTLGARPLLTGPDTFSLEIGELGVALTNAGLLSAISQWTNPAYNSGEYATTGLLKIQVLALRNGSVLLGS